METIKKEKLYNPKDLGGLSLHKLELRQKAFYKQKILDIIENPTDDHNILLMSRLGPYPKLQNLLEPKPKISYTQVENEKKSNFCAQSYQAKRNWRIRP